MFIGIVLGLFIMVAVYLATMVAYFAVKKKFVHKKYCVEIGVIGFALLLSVSIRLVVAWYSGSLKNAADGVENIFLAIHSAIGGFSFDGLDTSDSETLNSVLRCLYSGTALYAGLIALSVITVGVSYEINSYLKLVWLKLFVRLSKKTDLYVFTCVTEDTLLVAEDIEKHYREGENKSRRFRIIFTGSGLDAFDRKNPLHREVMSKGYIYWSFSKKNSGSELSVIRKFRLGLKNYEGGKCENSRIRFFALKLGEGLVGLESENSDAVFDEIKAEVDWYYRKNDEKLKNAFVEFAQIGANQKEEYAKKLANIKSLILKNPVVDFYILTDQEINYGFYTRRIDRLIDKKMGEYIGNIEKLRLSKKGDDAFFTKYEELRSLIKSYFPLHIINEAVLAAKDLTENRIKAFSLDDGKNKGWEESIFSRDLQPDGDNLYRVCVLGFGKTGQHAAATLFTQTAHIDKKGVPSVFAADIYDNYSNEISGTYAYNHPAFKCVDCGTKADFLTLSEIKSAKLGDSFNPLFSDFGNREEAEKFMGFPVAAFHSVGCTGKEFMEKLDGNGGKCKGKRLFKAFIISLGTDEADVNAANALIDDFKREAYLGEPPAPFPQTIFVNIRDEKNLGKLNWTEEDELLFGSDGGKGYGVLKVIPFGLRHNMYSYNLLVDIAGDAKFNYAYEKMDKEKLVKFFDGAKEEGNAFEVFDSNSSYLGYNPLEIRRFWRKVAPEQQQSNASVRTFCKVYNKWLSDKKSLSAADVVWLAEWEHLRWNRFHMAGGWAYGKYGRSEKYSRRLNHIHNFLCPFSMLDSWTKSYDVANVINGYNLGK